MVIAASFRILLLLESGWSECHGEMSCMYILKKKKDLERVKKLAPKFNRSECLKASMESLIINFRTGTYLNVLCKKI